MPPRAIPSATSGDRGTSRGRSGSRGGRGGGPGSRGGPAGDRGGSPSGRGAATGDRGGSPGGRGAPGRGRGGGRGGPSGSPAILSTRPPVSGTTAGLPDPSTHITTVGVKRAGFGTSGRAIQIWTNHFEVKIPEGLIYHYDVISPSEKTLPARLNMEIIKRLQGVTAPQIFTPRAVYDGRKNMFAARELPFGAAQAHEFEVTLVDPPSPGEAARAGGAGRPPKVYKVKLTHVATINPEVLARFLQGKQSHDNTVLTAITALNVVIRMEPSLNYPFNVRSFFTDREQRDTGSGVVLWRGYFQSIRPAIGRMLINLDISTGMMYKPGPLLRTAGEHLGFNDMSRLVREPRERIKLQRFLAGLRIIVEIPGQRPPARRTPRVVRRLSANGASECWFMKDETRRMNVAQYFQETYNYTVRYPNIPCVEVGKSALIPMECCTIFAGQIMRKQIPPELTKAVVEFATKRPAERMQSIRAGLDVLAYGQSEYLRNFNMIVEPNAAPVSLTARVLDPPVLQYGQGSRQPTIKPRDGAWNLIDKKFIKPVTINRWCVAVFERQSRFRPDLAEEMVRGLLQSFASVGITVHETDPIIKWANSNDQVASFLRALGGECFRKNGNRGGPDLIVAVMPEASADLYMRVKHFGDITQGVATQCLRSMKCTRAKPQYFANVCLKINVKLGGINTIPDARSVGALTDPHNPTIVMGADVMHPAPGASDRPSYTALVGNVDSDTAKYIADCRAQTTRQEMIADLEEMATAVIKMYQGYRTGVEKKPGNPKRIIFYRDGVSEGEFAQVLQYELPQLKRACAASGVQAKITIIVVGKRHHVRFFPSQSDADRSGNCPAGTVVDKEIGHPTEFDFYLQSHGGLLGTSRPAHYSVLYDENNFTPDSLQALSFALCHVYARSTRSVSIPAPVYYADIVCSRAKNHYDPDGGLDLESSGGTLEDTQRANQLEAFRAAFRPLNPAMRKVMYFS